MYKYPEESLIVSEIALSLYPQLIKLVPASLETQVAVRFLTYSILASLGYFIFGSNKLDLTIKSRSSSWWYYIIMGLVNIFHIMSSYISYKILPSGIAYSLFYTYPIFNLLSRSIFFGESFNLSNYLYIALAIIGVYYVYSNGHKQSLNQITEKAEKNKEEKEDNNIENTSFINKFTSDDRFIGLFMGLGSAITESLIYLMVKVDVPEISPFIQIIKTYLLGGILSTVYIFKNLENISLDWNYWITLILFNTIIGYIGYVIRFFTIPRLSTLAFNSLVFIGVISAYLWGYIFSNETIKLQNILGTLLIVISVFQLNKK
jgi:drug/metabolite transporter (DMT)-like permease